MKRLSEETSNLMGASGDNVNFGALQLLSRPKAENPSSSIWSVCVYVCD